MEYTKELNGLNSWYKKLQYLYRKLIKPKQKTYIIPTKFGLAYGLLCFVLLLMGMSYGNNLVYIVCFYLTVMGLAMAKLTNDHVDSVYIEKVFVKDAFAEKDQFLHVVIRNTTKKTLKNIEVRIARQKYIVSVDLKPEESTTVDILWTPQKRGKQQLPVVRVQSSYPAGLFGAWKIMKEPEFGIIFAARRGAKNFPSASFDAQDSIGVLREIRDYKAGDSPKRIHWRSLAKVGQLRTLVHEGNEGQICYFDWSQVQNLPLEERIEQLTLWISLAESQAAPWSLKLPHLEYDSTNPNAAKAAMAELAVWGNRA